ncbi:hypothetical protein [Phenylobacterium sp.]|uniref:hypothetical protein n=1 Tax=Phenylobacterium sp. TaxID=1871053 RepID=UPI0025CFC032|nr:hypothetical protein [Phenylobacterium sp.]
MTLPGNPARDLTPLDLRLLEPDLLGAVTLVVYGRGPQLARSAGEARAFTAKPRPERR